MLLSEEEVLCQFMLRAPTLTSLFEQATGSRAFVMGTADARYASRLLLHPQ